MKTLQKPKKKVTSKPDRELWNRINELKDSKEGVLSSADLDNWEKSSLPKDFARSSKLKLKNASKVRRGDIWSAIQTAISITVDQHPEIQFIAANEEDSKKSIILQNVLDYIWDKGKGDIELYYLVLFAARYGTGIAECYYRADIRKIQDIEYYNPETGELKTKPKEITEYNDIYWETIDIRNFFPDNRAYDMDDAIDCFIRKVISYEQFKYKYDNSRYKRISEVIDNHGYLDSTSDEYRTESPFSDYNNEKVEIITYYNKLDDEKITLANGVEIQRIPIPYKHKQLPFVRCVFFPRGKEYFWGIGIPELLSHNAAALDTILNISIDKLKLSLNKPMLVGGGETLNRNQYLEAGQQIPVEDVRNFKEMEISPPDRTAIEMMNVLSQDAKFKTGVDDPMGGVKTGGTATENAIAKEAGLRRMKTFIRLLEGETMYRLGRLMIANIQQFYAEPLRIEKIQGEDTEVYRKLPINVKKVKDELGQYNYKEEANAYYEIRPEDIMGHFDVKVKANSSLPISRELEFQKRKEFIAFAAGSPLAQIVNWEKIGKETATYAFNDDGTKYLIDEIGIKERMKKLAEDENNAMLKGEEIPPTEGAEEFHTARHSALIDSQDFKNLDENKQQIILSHRDGEKMAQEQKQMAIPGMNTGGRPEGGSPRAAANQSPLGGLTGQSVGMPQAQTSAQPRTQIGAMR